MPTRAAHAYPRLVPVPEDVPEQFIRALRSLRAVTVRPEIVLDEVPGPARIAPFSAALTAEVRSARRSLAADELASGRFVVLHDPAGQEAWDGTFRLVTLVRTAVEPEVGTDPHRNRSRGPLSGSCLGWPADSPESRGWMRHGRTPLQFDPLS